MNIRQLCLVLVIPIVLCKKRLASAGNINFIFLFCNAYQLGGIPDFIRSNLIGHVTINLSSYLLLIFMVPENKSTIPKKGFFT